MRIPFFTYKTPVPFGPWNLWPDRESMSILSSLTFTGTCPIAWTASVWKTTPFSLHTAPISLMGWTVPISLFAYMMVTRAVSSRIAALTWSGVTIPFSCTSKSSISNPSFSSLFNVCKTAWCSNAVDIMCFLPFFSPMRAAETIAWLSASLPPEVK